MKDGFPTPNKDALALRLKTARIAMGLTTREVASKMPQGHELSHATIANYEGGRSSPPIIVLDALSNIYGKPLVWFLSESPQLLGVQYRCRKSLVNKGDKAWFEANAVQILQAYAQLERAIDRPLKANLSFSNDIGKDPITLAKWIRTELKLRDADPVPSIVEVLEKFGIRVVEIATDLPIDGIAATFGQEFAVVTNSNTSSDRARMNAGHELLHVGLGDCGKPESKEMEDRAFLGASYLLLPDSELESAFKGQSMVRLVQFKERFGISLAAMIYRAREREIIAESTSKWLWIEFTRRGWRKKEPGHAPPDRATRFEQLLDEAIASERFTWHGLAKLTGMREETLRNRRRLALGYPVEDDLEVKGGDEKPPDVLQFPH